MMGRKDDSGKLPWHLVPWAAMHEVVAVLRFGAEEYGVGNWKFVKDARNRYFSALMRHVLAYERGELRDSKSGLHHLAHAITCLLFMLWFSLTGAEGQNDETRTGKRRNRDG